MTEPFVCCICPTRDRPEYLKRAVECFRAQTYPHKGLIIVNNGATLHEQINTLGGVFEYDVNAADPLRRLYSIGWLRNAAIRLCCDNFSPDLIAHFDDDDWSAPTRLAEQVAFIEAAGVPIVGYSDMPFYDELRNKVLLYDSRNPYYALGTSLMYRREFWEAHPFPDQNDEDTTWQNALEQTVGIAKCVRSESSLRFSREYPGIIFGVSMFATIHKGNTSAKQGARFQAASAELDRAVRSLLSLSNVPHSIGAA